MELSQLWLLPNASSSISQTNIPNLPNADLSKFCLLNHSPNLSSLGLRRDGISRGLLNMRIMRLLVNVRRCMGTLFIAMAFRKFRDTEAVSH